MLLQPLVVVAVLVVMAAVVAVAVGLSLVVVCSELLMHCLPCYVVILLLLRLSGRHGYTAKSLNRPNPSRLLTRMEVAGSCRLTAVCWSSLAARLLQTIQHELCSFS